MGRPLSLAVAGLFAIGLAAGNVLAASWDMPTPYPDGNFHTKNIAQFAKELDGATGGQIKIKIHSAGSLFKHKEIKGAVRKGLAPIGEVLISLHSNESPVYGIDSVPFLATSYEESRKLYAAQRPFLEKKLAEEGLMLLYSVPWPPQGLYAKREINAIGDLKGLKFRTYNVGTARIAELAGAAPVQIEVPDLPTAFATGRVDVMITSASTGVQSKAEEYLTHYYDTQAWLPRNVVFMSKKAYDALPADQRKAVIDAAKAAEGSGWKASIEEMTIKTAALKKAGIKVQPPSPALRDGLRKIGKTLSDDWVKSAGADGKAMLDAYAK